MGVYFAERDGLIKIGMSDCPSARVAALGATLLATVPGRYAEEREMHERFAEDRDHGEWFRPSPALLAFIADPDVDYQPRRHGLMTVGEVAEMYRVHPQTVREWADGGLIPAPVLKVGTKRASRYFRRADIEAAIARTQNDVA